MRKRAWLSRTIHLTIALSFIVGALVVAPSVSADPGTSKWEKQATPTEEDLVILPGSDITDFDVTGSDGMTIYAIGTWHDRCNGMDYTWSNAGYGLACDLFDDQQRPKLWKSTDGGVTWSDKTSKARGAKNLPDLGTAAEWDDFVYFTAVSAAPDNEDFVVITGYDANEEPVVVGSNDGAGKFYYMGCGTVDGFITCVDVSLEVDDKHEIAVGTWIPSPGINPNPYDSDDLAAIWRYTAGGYWSASWVKTTETVTNLVSDGIEYKGWMPVDAIVDLEFSPNFDVDDTIITLCVGDITVGTETGSTFFLQAGSWDSIDAWNSEAEFDGYPVLVRNDDTLFGALFGSIDPLLDVGALVRHLGDVDLPMDFMGDNTSDRKFMVAVNGIEGNPASMSTVDDGGFLFWVENATLSLELLDHEDNPYIASIDYNGNVDMEGRTLAGLAFPRGWYFDEVFDYYAGNRVFPCCTGVQVLRSETTDVCCPDWGWSCKPPSGQFHSTVMMTPDGDVAYAATQGAGCAFGFEDFDYNYGWWCDESAFSVSDSAIADVGKAWNQTALIDTDIDYITDVAVTSNVDGDDGCSPSCGCLYIATVNTAEYMVEVSGIRVSETERKVCDCDSIWRSCNGGDTWLRIWHKELERGAMNPDSPCDWPTCGTEWMVLGLVPGDEEAETIYMAELDAGSLWVSEDGGSVCCPAGVGCWTDRKTGLDRIADIAVLDSDTIYVVDFDGQMVKSTTGGRHWSSDEDTKVDDDDGENAHDIIAMGDWVVVGGDMGTVSYSDDGGDSFSVLDDIGDGDIQVHLAFDSYFDDNGYIYAATAECCGTPNPGFVPCGGGVYRTTIDDADFEDMDACDALAYWGITVSDGDGNPMTSASTGGVLYATYTAQSFACAHSGVARLLGPASQSCCGSLSWDYLFDDLWTNARFINQPTNIAICGDASGGATSIWAVDSWGYYDGWDVDCSDGKSYLEFSSGNIGRLWRFNDVFGKGGPELIGVADGATIPSDPCDCVNEDFVLEWDRLCDACEYDIEIALDEGFKHKVYTTETICDPWDGWYACSAHEDCNDGLFLSCEDPTCFYKPSDPCAPSIVVPQGTLDCNQTYWWRVRARAAETGEVYRSWWSEKWSFTIAVGPDGAIKLTAPVNGAMNVPLGNVVFTWTAVADADSYEVVLMDASGAELASNSGDATSFVLTSDLDWDSAYMWMVRAMKGSNVLSESGVSTFHTMSEPVPPPEYPETVINFPEPPGTPTWVWVVIALAAVLIIVVIVLVFRTRRV